MTDAGSIIVRARVGDIELGFIFGTLEPLTVHVT